MRNDEKMNNCVNYSEDMSPAQKGPRSVLLITSSSMSSLLILL